MDSEDPDFLLEDTEFDVEFDASADLLAAGLGQEELDAHSDDGSDSSSTSASVASSIIAITITSSDEENDQVTPRTPRNRSRVIASDPDESGSDCPEPPKKVKKTYSKIKPINDDSSSDSDQGNDNQPSTSKGPAKRNLFQSPIEQESNGADSDVQIIEEGQEQAPRRSRRLEYKRNPELRPPSPKRKGEISFEDGSEEDAGTDRSWDSEPPYEPPPEKDQCYICEELDESLRVLGRERITISKWCKCGCCANKGQMGDYDRICCQELKKVVEFMADENVLDRKCITEHSRFVLDVLQFRALERSNTRKSFRCNSRSKCFKAQWSYLRMIYDRIGFGGQAVVPACVSSAILKRFGNDGLSYNWQAKYHCKKGPHCHKMTVKTTQRKEAVYYRRRRWRRR